MPITFYILLFYTKSLKAHVSNNKKKKLLLSEHLLKLWYHTAVVQLKILKWRHRNILGVRLKVSVGNIKHVTIKIIWTELTPVTFILGYQS